MLNQRSLQPERIDTGDYTQEEYERFLVDISFINRYFGDNRALKKHFLPKISSREEVVRILDVGAGSGELLRTIADTNRKEGYLHLVGLDFNSISAKAIREKSASYESLHSVQGDAFSLPFENNAFHFVISSLFTHHLTDHQIVQVLAEMKRVAENR